jgi:hypothetical protein
VYGSIQVDPGGSLYIDGATMYGPLTSSQASAIDVCALNLSGEIDVENSTGLVLMGGDSATPVCAGNTINGPVYLNANTDGVEFNGNNVNGPATIAATTGTLPAPDSGSVEATGNQTTGPLTID